MNSEEFKADVKSIQNKMMSTTASPSWKELRFKVEAFMNESRRTWASAIFYLLEKGLENEQRNDQSTR